jgi:hypothetical protein
MTRRATLGTPRPSTTPLSSDADDDDGSHDKVNHHGMNKYGDSIPQLHSASTVAPLEHEAYTRVPEMQTNI